MARGRPPPGRRLVFCIYLVYLIYICIYLVIFWYFFWPLFFFYIPVEDIHIGQPICQIVHEREKSKVWPTLRKGGVAPPSRYMR